MEKEEMILGNEELKTLGIAMSGLPMGFKSDVMNKCKSDEENLEWIKEAFEVMGEEIQHEELMAKKVESGLAEVLAENQKLTAEDCCKLPNSEYKIRFQDPDQVPVYTRSRPIPQHQYERAMETINSSPPPLSLPPLPLLPSLFLYLPSLSSTPSSTSQFPPSAPTMLSQTSLTLLAIPTSTHQSVLSSAPSATSFAPSHPHCLGWPSPFQCK